MGGLVAFKPQLYYQIQLILCIFMEVLIIMTYYHLLHKVIFVLYSDQFHYVRKYLFHITWHHLSRTHTHTHISQKYEFL